MTERILGSVLDTPPEIDFEALMAGTSTPFEWKEGINLMPGMVVRFSHDLNENITVFECTSPEDARETTGLLTEFTGREMLSWRQEVTMDIDRPSAYGHSWIRFLRDHTSIKPAFTEALTFYSQELGEWLHDQQVAEQRLAEMGKLGCLL